MPGTVSTMAIFGRHRILHWPASVRVGMSALVGAVATLISAACAAPWQLTVLAGWNSTALAFLAQVWASIVVVPPEAMPEAATAQDASRRLSNIAVVTAASASFIGVIFGLHRANTSHGALRGWLIAAVLGGVICSWAVLHTVFTLRYAHAYFTPPVGGIGFGGIDFGGDEVPDFVDFAYLSFTLGMTFQVSDNIITTRAMRRVVLGHCLLSFVFVSAILATSINVVAGLV